MSDEMVAATCHAWPFSDLRPELEDRYTAFLRDYLAIKGAITRDLGSASTAPSRLGCCGGLAAWRRGAAARGGPVGGDGLFFVLASVGPSALDSGAAAPLLVNPVFLPALRGAGRDILLEPFRYGLPAASPSPWRPRWAWTPWETGWGAPSPPPWSSGAPALASRPLPVAQPTVPPWMATLDAELPAGPHELPCSRRVGALLPGADAPPAGPWRPIGAGIGPPPQLLPENGSPVRPCRGGAPGALRHRRRGAGRDRGARSVVADGFAAILVHPGQYRSAAHADAVAAPRGPRPSGGAGRRLDSSSARPLPCGWPPWGAPRPPGLEGEGLGWS